MFKFGPKCSRKNIEIQKIHIIKFSFFKKTIIVTKTFCLFATSSCILIMCIYMYMYMYMMYSGKQTKSFCHNYCLFEKGKHNYMYLLDPKLLSLFFLLHLSPNFTLNINYYRNTCEFTSKFKNICRQTFNLQLSVFLEHIIFLWKTRLILGFFFLLLIRRHSI